MNERVRKFLSYYTPYRGLLVADILCAVFVAAIALVLPLGARVITEQVLTSPGPDALAQILAVGAGMVALVIVQTLCNTFVDYQGHMMGTLMERDMRAELFAHYQTLPFSFYDEQRTGQLMARLTHDLNLISELAHHGPEEGIIAVLKFVGAFVILSSLNAGLTLLLFLTLPVMAIYALYFNRRMLAALGQYHDRMGDIHSQIEDTLGGIRVVKSFSNEDLERRKFAEINTRFVETRRLAYASEGWFYGGMMAFTQGLTIVVIVLGGIAILHGALTLADLVTYLLFVAILIDPIQKFTNLARLLQDAATGFSRFLEILAIAPDIRDAPDAVVLSDVRGQITFDRVSFHYRPEQGEVLRDVSLDIRAGEYVALVGPSGVGKTTLLSLIPRFYDVTSGAVRLDGRDIRRVTQRSLRQQIGVVQQDVYLFAGTVLENILYGRPDASRAEVIAAARRANAHDFIESLPEGYDTDVGQRGVKLSGGQKQRLSLARVFLKDPPVILLDEATSALDNESERVVQEALETLAHDRTLIVIAHRLSTVRNADRILVLADGGIAEQGSHNELLAQGGIYAGLVSAQLMV